jgi:hypothetical protein
MTNIWAQMDMNPPMPGIFQNEKYIIEWEDVTIVKASREMEKYVWEKLIKGNARIDTHRMSKGFRRSMGLPSGPSGNGTSGMSVYPYIYPRMTLEILDQIVKFIIAYCMRNLGMQLLNIRISHIINPCGFDYQWQVTYSWGYTIK